VPCPFPKIGQRCAYAGDVWTGSRGSVLSQYFVDVFNLLVGNRSPFLPDAGEAYYSWSAKKRRWSVK